MGAETQSIRTPSRLLNILLDPHELDPKANFLNPIRFVLAVLVLVTHSWPISGAGADPNVNGFSPGAVAVFGFFGISGYLITASRLASRSNAVFAMKRLLRIYPAFICTLLLTGLVLAPLAAMLQNSQNYSVLSSLRYVGVNSGIYQVDYTIAGTLDHQPRSQAWNGSLWTLFFECLCYVVIALMVSVFRSRRILTIALSVTLALCVSFNLLRIWEGHVGQETGGAYAAIQLAPFFCSGALLYLLKRRIELRWLAFCLILIAVVCSYWTPYFSAVAALGLTYLVLFVAAVVPLTNLFRRTDVSYGMYIYAFPLQQIIAVSSGGALTNPALFAAASIAVTLPVSYLSWRFVEGPMLRLKFSREGTRKKGDANAA